MVRNSLMRLWKDYKGITGGLKLAYQAPTEESALMAMNTFAVKWNDKHPQVSKSWRAHWENYYSLIISREARSKCLH